MEDKLKTTEPLRCEIDAGIKARLRKLSVKKHGFRNMTHAVEESIKLMAKKKGVK